MPVDGFNFVLRTGVAGYASLFGGLHPMVGLTLVSAICGIGMLWVVGKTSNQTAITTAKKRMQAYLLEMRLYRDEPSVVLRAQGRLLLHNGRYVGHMLRPALFLGLPMIVLYAHLDAVYGQRPMRVGEVALLTVETALPAERLNVRDTATVALDSVSVEQAEESVAVWRLRAVRDGTDALVLETPGGEIEKAAAVGSSGSYLSAVRAAAWWQRFLFAPGENRFSVEGVSSVTIEYSSRQIGLGAWKTHWAVWFFGISIVTAFLLRNRFGVAL